jgi:hypothetical protein
MDWLSRVFPPPRRVVYPAELVTDAYKSTWEKTVRDKTLPDAPLVLVYTHGLMSIVKNEKTTRVISRDIDSHIWLVILPKTRCKR